MMATTVTMTNVNCDVSTRTHNSPDNSPTNIINTQRGARRRWLASRAACMVFFLYSSFLTIHASDSNITKTVIALHPIAVACSECKETGQIDGKGPVLNIMENEHYKGSDQCPACEGTGKEAKTPEPRFDSLEAQIDVQDQQDLVVKMDVDLSRWMQNSEVQKKRVRQLNFPAAHNAHAYTCSKMLGWVVPNLVYRATKCQNLNILDQLNVGIRALDFRVNSGKRFSHGAIRTALMEDAFDHIKKFLEENKQEVIFIKVGRDKRCNIIKMGNYAEASKNFEDILNEKMPDQWIALHKLEDNTTIEELVNNKTRVVLMFKDKHNIKNAEAMASTYKKTKATNADELAKKAYAHSLQTLINAAKSPNKPKRKFTWLTLQVTSALKAMFTGYAGMSEKVAKEALKICPTLVADIDGDKINNFIGMDYVGDTVASLELIQFIVKQNQIPYVSSLPEGVTVAAGAQGAASSSEGGVLGKVVPTSIDRLARCESRRLADATLTNLKSLNDSTMLPAQRFLHRRNLADATRMAAKDVYSMSLSQLATHRRRLKYGVRVSDVLAALMEEVEDHQSDN